MENIIKELYKLIDERKKTPIDNSYTKYLFDKGIDKILKKVGEETTELIVASKNQNKSDIIEEFSDLTYHLLVLISDLDIDIVEIEKCLEGRMKKMGNLKSERREIVDL
ncbi:MAG: phosphoribosyl-ATP diphosphatase [Sarcina sp.]